MVVNRRLLSFLHCAHFDATLCRLRRATAGLEISMRKTRKKQPGRSRLLTVTVLIDLAGCLRALVFLVFLFWT